MTKHMPGPWSFEKSGLINGRNGKLVAEAFGDDIRGDQPNARLIAAAPELLDSLNDFLNNPLFQVGVGGNPIAVDRMIDKARAAIAKATGKP